MRLRSRRVVANQKPFAGGRGAALYFGAGAGGVDPGPSCLQFRRLRLMGGRFVKGQHFDFGNGLKKISAVATTLDPTAQFTWQIPASAFGQLVYLQVRTFWDECEEITNYRPLRLQLDGSGNILQTIFGTGAFVSLEKRDGGIYRLRFAFYAALGGGQPTQFRLTKTSGPGTLADVTTRFTAGVQQYTLDTAALQDGGTYVFNLQAENATSSKLLAGNTGSGPDIDFVADAAGPPAPASATLTLK